ncbi:uncharacterized protein LOC111518541 [Drosophila willistoni]|uniref:uncharacterized protein LOC111518541 n=1 Tax=Drosophila willistoni TaxID=7260 RepID=UPI000C26D430|nr:uncharacterized protein LOC111518541 [Drosophila willistoni]
MPCRVLQLSNSIIQSSYSIGGSNLSFVSAQSSGHTLCYDGSGESEAGLLFGKLKPMASNALPSINSNQKMQFNFSPGEKRSNGLFKKAQLVPTGGVANGERKPTESTPFVSLPPIYLNLGRDLDDSAKQVQIGGWLVAKNESCSLSAIYSIRGIATREYIYSIPSTNFFGSVHSSRDNDQYDSSSDDSDDNQQIRSYQQMGNCIQIGQSKPMPNPLLRNRNFRARDQAPKYEYGKIAARRQTRVQRHKLRELKKKMLLHKIGRKR